MSSNYVNGKDLYNEIIICKDSSICSNRLIEMFTLISRRYTRNISYNNEDDLEDIIQGGIIDAVLYFDRFNPSKSKNAFAYITQIIHNGHLKTYRVLYPNRKHSIKKISLNNIWSI